MDILIWTASPRRRLFRAAVAVLIVVMGAVLLLFFNQPVAAAMLPCIGVLLSEIARRDRRARLLAHWITGGRLSEKIEVRRGVWGDLSRAINGLLQERRVQQRLHAILPAPMPAEALHTLLAGGLSPAGHPRVVVVMLVRQMGRQLGRGERGRRAALVAWQALAQTVQDVALRHNALLQPCGDAIMLVFGAFEERSPNESLRGALEAAESLRQSWHSGGVSAGGPLLMSLASGHTLALVLPGLGYCVLGTPVEQAVQLQQLALQSRQYGLLCSEDVYYVLRHGSKAGWRPTDLRIPVPNRPPQVVYGWNDVR